MPKYKLLLNAIFAFSCTMVGGSLLAQATEPESCGEQPVHVCIMMDRTGSVSSTERADEAAAAKGLIDQIAALNNGTKVAIGRFGDGSDGGSDAEMRDAEPGTGGFQTFTTNYAQAKTAVDNAMGSSSSVQTNLEDAVEVCRNALIANRAANVQDIMILISDGDTNDRDEAPPDGSSENQNENDDDPFNSPIFSDSDYDAALDAAREAKGLDPYLQTPLTTLNPGIRLFTIAFGAEGSGDGNARKLLALMASGNAQDDHCDDTGDLSCSSAERATENNDGDDYFISPKTQTELAGVLSLIFQVIQCQDDGNPCTVESCNEDTNLCESENIDNCVPCQTALDCNDGNDCTTEACVDNRCSISTANDNTPCNDNNLCTDGESCQAGVCGSPTSNVQCSPLDECHVAGVCNPATGQCSNPNKPDGSTCSNDDSCSSGENCQAGLCVPGAPISCDDMNDCTADACDGGADECSHTPVEPGTECDDHNICTVQDQCGEEDALGTCVSQPKNCDDSNVCTDDTCDSESDCDPQDDPDCGCVHTPNDHQEACYSGPEGTEGVGLCKGGIKSCEAGQLGTCEGEVTPVQELCDGLDNDCDGEIDEDFDLGASCDGVDADLCEEGKLVCKPDGSGTQCDDPNDVDVEICDGQDNDCNPRTTDGVQDPGLGQDCDGQDGDACNEGKLQCEGGSLSCSDNTDTNAELCNGQDDDCDGSVDEGFDLGESCDGTDADLCEEGKLVCKADGSGTMCDDPNDSDPEVCDGQDNDCNPATTDGVQDPGLGKDCDGEDGDSCNEGKLQCEGGSLSCSDNTDTNIEICNGQDDDCDGSIDEGFDLGESCDGTDADLCEEGKLVCKADGSGTMCDDPNDSDPEVCDGEDNDCNPSTTDGVQDPNLGKDCDGEDGDSCNEGKLQCEGGSLSCSDDTGTNAELCNGQDDDCDGSIDEDFSLGVSCDGTDADLCEEGKLVCKADGSGTMCDDPNDSDPEVCDGEDNDCDEAVDEDIAPTPTSCGVGVCAANGQKVCEGGTFVDSCKPGLPTGDDTDCDGSDNDCDGSSDNHYQPKETDCGVGACASTGTTSCVDGKEFDSCEPGEGSEDDADCDGVDDDCDGTPDDDYQPQETECGVGACARTGTLTCQGGEEVDSCEEGVPTVEECDGVDNDCDEVVDNGGDGLCNDGNPCTDDACNGGEGGCSHTENSSCEPPPCSDQDSDGICDEQDNCDNTPNPDQADENQNGVGDACEEGGDDSGAGGGPLGPNCLQGSGDFGDGSNGCQGYACSLNRNAPERDPAATAAVLGLLALGGMWLMQRRRAGRGQTALVRILPTRKKLAKAGLIGAGALVALLFQADPVQAGTICFCHATGSTSNPFNTICTSNAGQQNGHTNHGDPDFGCGCGDNVCDPNDGETCGTCPQDCGACPACGDGNADDGEECGDPGTVPGTCTAPETCEGCRCVPPPPVCGNNDQELGEECDGTDSAACGNLGCTEDCECDRCGNGLVDSGEECDNPNDPCCNADCTFNTGNRCDDGKFCTENDTCNGGACNGSPKSCDDGIQCTVDSCNETSDQCENPTSTCECRTDADCGDGNSCTDEYCDQNTLTCVRSHNSNPCDDGLFCNGKDTCGGGTCSIHGGDPCAAGGECADSCNEEKDSCNDPAGTSCKDDGNVCTDNECNGSGECVPVNNDDTCDDGKPCTENDVCSGGACNGKPKTCDDGIECTPDFCDTETGECQAPTDKCECVQDSDCSDDNSCTDEHCDLKTLTCVRSHNSNPCDDGLFCNGKDTCGGGTCSIHGGDPCAGGGECADSCNEEKDSCNDPAGTACTDDGNVCTDNECNGSGECVATNNDDSCDDGDLCTVSDVCSGGACNGSPKTCDDGIECTPDFCEAETGECQAPTSECECVQDSDCNDGNSCTDEYCDLKTLTCSRADNSNPCDDGLFCNGKDTCGSGTCSLHAGDPCAGGGECADSCDEAKDSCNDPAGTACTDDGNLCTDNECNGSGECVPTNNDDACDDGKPCTVGDVCSGGACNGTPKTCDDGIECTPDFCDTETGECEAPTSECECVQDSDCNDNNSCTDEYCDLKTLTCARADNSNPCDDGLFCNGKDTCGSGTCSLHAGDPCAAGGECADSCDEEKDSCNDPAGTVCTDDGNVCTDNTCNGSGECVPTNNKDACDDGNLCTLNDVCSEGSCQSGSPKSCADDRDCSEDSCDSKTGQCLNDLSQCQCSADEDCNDGNACTIDSCDFVGGTCSNTPDLGAECNDGNACTENEQCNAEGLCEGATLSCDDGNACTADSCDVEVGCGHEPIPNCPPPGCTDTDADGVCDDEDNCDQTPNPDQADSNQNGVGDACEEGGDDSGQGGGPVGPTCLQGSGDFGDGANGCQGYACSLNRQAASADPAALAGLLALGLGLAPWMLLRFKAPGRFRRNPR